MLKFKANKGNDIEVSSKIKSMGVGVNMKIAVLSDIHGNGIALNCVIEDIKRQNIDKIIILGDVVMKGPMPMQVLESLRKFDVLAWIKGNTEMWFEEINEKWIPETNKEKELYSYYMYAREKMQLEDIAFINNLPLEYTLTYNNVKILCVHGTPKSIVEAIDGTVPVEDIKEIIKDVDEDIILCGHSHCSFIGEVQGKKIFNTGSIGNSLDGDNRASYGILDFTDGNVQLINRRISYSINELVEVAEKNNFPNFSEYKNIIMNASMN